jgi:Rps23 Pro-64 3,4-dihydroxylase Tpa1-like proline 4-hydroxylase
MFFTRSLQEHPVAVAIQSRLQSLVSSTAAALGRSERSLTEALQVVKYSVGDFYALHRDNDHNNDAHDQNHALRRAATAIIYLTSTPSHSAGGHTCFPHASAILPRTKILEANGVKYLKTNSGFVVQPQQGHILLFWSAQSDGTEDLAAVHEASPVLVGEKLIATHWFAEREQTK